MSHVAHPGLSAPRPRHTQCGRSRRDASLPLRRALGPRRVLLPFPLSAWSLRLTGKNSPWSHRTQGRTGARTQTVTFWARAGDHYRVITDAQPQLLGEMPVLLAHGKPLAADTPRAGQRGVFLTRQESWARRRGADLLSGGHMEGVPLSELLH